MLVLLLMYIFIANIILNYGLYENTVKTHYCILFLEMPFRIKLILISNISKQECYVNILFILYLFIIQLLKRPLWVELSTNNEECESLNPNSAFHESEMLTTPSVRLSSRETGKLLTFICLYIIGYDVLYLQNKKIYK